MLNIPTSVQGSKSVHDNQYKIKNNRIARRTLKVVAASRPGTSKRSEFVSYCSQYCVNSKLEFNDANIMRTSIRRLAIPTSPPCYPLRTTCVCHEAPSVNSLKLPN